MSKQLLKKDDIIRIEEGIVIYAIIPEKFIFDKSIFSDRFIEQVITVGKLYNLSDMTYLNLEKTLENTIRHTLETYEMNSSIYDKQISDFIKSLNLKIKDDTCDTSFLKGDYRVIDSYDAKPKRVYCKKLDNSEIEIIFEQDDNNNNYITVLKN